MRVLFIGDLVGPQAVEYVVDRVPDLRAEHGIDLVIANAENCHVSGHYPAAGFGMDMEAIERLLAHGVDIITSGNHAWDGAEAEQVLAHPRVLRPCNVPSDYPGKGVATMSVGGETVTVVNVTDRSAVDSALPAYPLICGEELEGTVLIDYHGGDVMQKLGFAHAMDGRVAAVLGTHTHEPTQTLHLLAGGTSFVVDVGMTGPTGGWQGIDPAHLIAWYLGEDATDYPPFALAAGPVELGAVLLNIDNGRTTTITRVH